MDKPLEFIIKDVGFALRDFQIQEPGQRRYSKKLQKGEFVKKAE